jgi:hypothetical protein
MVTFEEKKKLGMDKHLVLFPDTAEIKTLFQKGLQL